MTSFILGFFACYLCVCVLEYRLACAWSRSNPIYNPSLRERIVLALIWPITHYGMADDQ
jgi:hypothetical protein